MNELCQIIKNMVIPNFINMETSIRTYDRDADCCGAPAWRYVYHALHSADKWFINPFVYDEPAFHQEGMDNPDRVCSVICLTGSYWNILRKSGKKPVTTWMRSRMICSVKSPKTVRIQDWSWYSGNSGIFLFTREC